MQILTFFLRVFRDAAFIVFAVLALLALCGLAPFTDPREDR